MKSGTVALLLLLVVSPASRGERPHPQDTYGALHFTPSTFLIEPEGHDTHKSPSTCWPGWTKNTDGSLHFLSCPDGSTLLEELGELVEDDPDYNEKKRLLIKMIKDSRNS